MTDKALILNSVQAVVQKIPDSSILEVGGGCASSSTEILNLTSAQEIRVTPFLRVGISPSMKIAGEYIEAVGSNSFLLKLNSIPMLSFNKTPLQTTVQDSVTLNTTGAGNIDLPNNSFARFKIETVSVGSTVTASNLTDLTNTSVIESLHYHNKLKLNEKFAGETVFVGSPVGVESVDDVPKFFLSGAAEVTNRHNVIGFSDRNATVDQFIDLIISGETLILDDLWDHVPDAADIGKVVYLSDVTGKLSITPPITLGQFIQKLGTIISAGVSNETKIFIRIGDYSVVS